MKAHGIDSLREALAEIFRAALDAVRPEALVSQALQGRQPRGRVVVVGGGKASAAMAAGVARLWTVSEGLVIVKEGYGRACDPIRVVEGGHPLPNHAGVAGAQALCELLDRCGGEDHVVACISGGGSALLTVPRAPHTLPSIRAETERLLRSGAAIGEINALRRSWSLLADGGLGARAAPAAVTGLILSDVLDSPIADIASGPTLGAENLLIGDLDLAIDAALGHARMLGWPVRVGSRRLVGEARDAGQWLASQSGCVICGGETTVTVTGTGQGGRCQELALSAAIAIRGRPDVAILAAGTDGTDGPTSVAGAIVDGTTADSGAEAALRNNDSYRYLAERGALLTTGPTLTNVGDLQIRLQLR